MEGKKSMEKQSDMERLKKDSTTQKYFNPMTKKLTEIFIKNIISEIETIKPAHMLDVGCGTGYVTEKVSFHCPSVVACDVAYERLITAGNYCKDKHISFIQNDKHYLPFKHNSFDLILCLEVLEHVKEYEKLLEEIKRTAKDYVIISVPHEPFFRMANFLRGKNVKRWGNDIDHINFFNKGILKTLLEKYFLIDKIFTSTVVWLIAVCRKK